ncbi:MAG: tetratricopeptide repeat protein [Prosthecobacter sp.]|uniref:tetratricopeptide repeat protein n=1 Tax=Prosthecobacter sp. TaxID=1965333 RepID=UPI0025FA9450|nr:tetratricopeptide repeat protein [Prosthecobacter sp.]MCF7788113.1 tetratricopeptide repeat protein [Prosthecobacter sp.]
MRLLQTFLFLTLGIASALAQTPAPAPAPVSDAVKKLLMEARTMRVKQRYSEALEKLDAAEKINPNVADIYAMRGDIYLAPRRRDFDLALPQFEKAAQLQPDSPLPKFNLAEYYFVKHDFTTALQSFTKLITDYPKLPMVIRHLVHYKRALCEIKLGHRPAADQIIAENFTFMDDTPAYYFCKAAIAFDLGDPNKGNEWVKRGVAAFKAPNCEPYYDAFKELRWVPDLDFATPPDAPVKP